MREASRHLFIPRRPLIASMLSSDPERSWFRIAKASLISSTRPSLISVSAPFSMTRRFPLPPRRSFASIDRVMGSISGLWLPPRDELAARQGADPADLEAVVRFANDNNLVDRI